MKFYMTQLAVATTLIGTSCAIEFDQSKPLAETLDVADQEPIEDLVFA